MPYKLLSLNEVEGQLSRFLMERYGGVPYARKAAANAVREALRKLEINPHLAMSPPGPFETRPVYRFTIDVEDIVSHVQFAFKYAEDENHLVLTKFGEAPS